MQPKATITKKDLLRAPAGHPQRICGTGTHRNWKKSPKGGRKAELRRCLKDFG